MPAGLEPEDVTIEQALFLLSLPLTVGEHPELKKDVKIGIGRFGPYVVCDGDFRSIPKTENLFEVGFDFAMGLLSQPKRGRGSAAALKELGKHPEVDEDMNVFNGRYGPYIKMGKINVSLPEDLEIEDVTASKAIELLADKLTKTKKKKAKKKKAKAKVTKAGAKVKKKAKAKVSKETTVPKKKTIIRRSSTAE